MADQSGFVSGAVEFAGDAAKLYTSNTGALVSKAATASSDASSNWWNSLLSKVLSPATLENTIFILIGLLLIAAGIFSFKTTQNIVQVSTGYGAKLARKTAPKLAEVAAA